MHAKKLISLLLCLLLCAAACSAAAVEYNAYNIFTITYDENQYAFNNTAYLEENTSSYIWLFMLYQQAMDVVVDVEMEHVPEFDSLTLYTASVEDRNSYVNATLDAFVDQDIRLMDTFTVSDMGIPFYVYSMTDEAGEHLTAETIVDGWAISFSTYHTKTSDADETLLTVMEEIVTSFIPVT